MDRYEALAQQVVQAVIVGSRMDYRADQSTRTHDFDLHLPDGSVAALEVTASADPEYRSTEDAILNGRGGQFIDRAIAQHDWIVYPRSGARISQIRTKVDRYLADIEAEGLRRFHAELEGGTALSVRRISHDLGIEAGSVSKWKPPGRIAIGLLGGGGWTGPGPVWDALRDEAVKLDNREKLRVSGAQARHLFVFIDESQSLPWLSLQNLPSGPMPSLPAEYTHAWVAATYDRQVVALYGATDSHAWERVVVQRT